MTPTSTPIPFDATTTAQQVVDGLDLSGRRVIVTGGASGIGVETARALATAGADVTIAVRNVDAGRVTAADIERSSGRPVQVALLDLASLDSVDAFVASWDGPLHVLVNNAGVMATPFSRTADGWELQFGTNHLGHFALADGLAHALAEAGDARVVSVSSVGHINGGIDFDDPNFEHREYDPWVAYSQSKTADILFAVEAARRWAEQGTIVNALNPGRISSTNLGRHVTPPPASFDPAGSTGVSVKTIEQGASTSVLLAASPLVAGVTGAYFEDCQPAVPHVEGVRRGVAAYALDSDDARRLWQLSASLLAASRSTRSR